jgi:putative FmdB family regulatory protein
VPTYTYKCTACDDVIEKRQSFSDPPLTTCEQCGGAVRKVIHPVGIVFKGSGWYITDSRSASAASSNGRSSKDKATEGAGAKSSETTSESTSKSKETSSSSTSTTTTGASAKSGSSDAAQ